MTKESADINWDLTRWEGSRREQLRRWSKLTMDEILNAQEEMASLADELKLPGSAKVREEAVDLRLPPSNS